MTASWKSLGWLQVYFGGGCAWGDAGQKELSCNPFTNKNFVIRNQHRHSIEWNCGLFEKKKISHSEHLLFASWQPCVMNSTTEGMIRREENSTGDPAHETRGNNQPREMCQQQLALEDAAKSLYCLWHVDIPPVFVALYTLWAWCRHFDMLGNKWTHGVDPNNRIMES